MSVRLLVGDVRDRIREIPDRSVDLVACSPPFLALRKYGDNTAEMGSERTPADFLDALLELTQEFRRVLTPHGSIAIELGDTYSSVGGITDNRCDSLGGNDFAPRRERGGGAGWPLAKSLTLIPTLYPASLAYGYNMLNPAHTFDRWRVRNVIVWARPNPPVGALGDKVRPATSYITVACTSAKRWFDLDAVRTEGSPNTHARLAQGVESRPNDMKVPPDSNRGSLAVIETAGAPPLDWWEDDDPTGHATLILPTQPYSGWTTTTRQVPCGPLDGGRRTTSPDCPTHAGLPGQLPKALRDARAGTAASRNGDTDAGHVQEPLLGFAPIAQPHEPPTAPSSSDSPDRSYAAAASAHSTASNRTDPAPVTSPPDSASAETAASTGDTPAQPELSGPHHDTASSSSAAVCPPADAPGTASDTARTLDPPSACTCSFTKTVTERTSHYATWPEKLAARLILMMCPLRVCTTCGEPSRRIVGDSERYAARRASHTWASGGQVKGHAKPASSVGWDDGSPVNAEHVTLGWSDCGCESCTCDGHDHRGVVTRCKFCDCDLANHWRPGRILDPFAGSGTTLAVAQGLGRDATGIELYEANADLVRDRVGMFLETA